MAASEFKGLGAERWGLCRSKCAGCATWVSHGDHRRARSCVALLRHLCRRHAEKEQHESLEGLRLGREALLEFYIVRHTVAQRICGRRTGEELTCVWQSLRASGLQPLSKKETAACSFR